MKELEEMALIDLVKSYAVLYHEIRCHEEQYVLLPDKKYKTLLNDLNIISNEILSRNEAKKMGYDWNKSFG